MRAWRVRREVPVRWNRQGEGASERERERDCLFVGWLLNVPATG